MSEHPHPHPHPHKHHFFLDSVRYETEEASLTGAAIKAFNPNIPATYQLFLEEEGDTPDRAISDGEGVPLSDGKVRHFYAVPPATFGK